MGGQRVLEKQADARLIDGDTQGDDCGRHHRAPSSTDDKPPQAKGSSYDSFGVERKKSSSLLPSGRETIIRLTTGQDSIGGLRSL
jgi:hypothetical protein